MKKALTKEEFLDKRNSELLKEVSEAMNLKSEIEVLLSYVTKKQREGLKLCRLERRKVAGVYPKYKVHDLLIRFVEALDKGELIFKSDL